MSGIKSTTINNVEITHHSTSSQYEVTITTVEEVSYGQYGKVQNRIWLSYSEFDSLYEAMGKIKP